MKTYFRNYLNALLVIRPNLASYAQILLTAVSSIVFKDRGICLTIWLVGKSSSGKGELMTLMSKHPPDKIEQEREIFYQSDRFTEASFISNRADVKKEEDRKKLDLLRRLPHKVLITPELGAFLSGHKDKLSEKFGVLTRVLDGQGLATDTGAHGRRAIDEKVEFVWIGGTTELAPQKHEALSQIGGRIMTLDMEPETPSLKELAKAIREGFPSDEVEGVSQHLSIFFEKLFEKFPTNSVSSSSIKIPELESDLISHLAQIGATLRSPVIDRDGDEGVKASIEHPFRFARNLHLLARTSALLNDRSSVNIEDIATVILPLALSAGPELRHKLFSELLITNGGLTVDELTARLGFSKSQLYKGLKELRALGLVVPGPCSVEHNKPKINPVYLDLLQKILLGIEDNIHPSPPILKKAIKTFSETRGKRLFSAESSSINNGLLMQTTWFDNLNQQ